MEPGQLAGKYLGGVVVNGFQMGSHGSMGAHLFIPIGGAGGGYAGGFTGGLLMTGDLSAAHQAGLVGMKSGAPIGAVLVLQVDYTLPIKII